IRDRALILALLRTGMRIGELLNTQVEDLNLREQRIQIIEAQKNRVGRVVYLSTDAVDALGKWMQTRTYPSEFIFYGRDILCHGRGTQAKNPAGGGGVRPPFSIFIIGFRCGTSCIAV
ncbi:tyrosine-type recombinase/integrase, partial [Desulfosarcina sp.]|uniref:tyrosine-type recombinase/integrase n=1 Tax=Desulfosarcina sp. TaxID=2027861 RepID=UPI0039710414